MQDCFLYTQDCFLYMYKTAYCTCTRLLSVHVQDCFLYMYKTAFCTCTRLLSVHVQIFAGYNLLVSPARPSQGEGSFARQGGWRTRLITCMYRWFSQFCRSPFNSYFLPVFSVGINFICLWMKAINEKSKCAAVLLNDLVSFDGHFGHYTNT